MQEAIRACKRTVDVTVTGKKNSLLMTHLISKIYFYSCTESWHINTSIDLTHKRQTAAWTRAVQHQTTEGGIVPKVRKCGPHISKHFPRDIKKNYLSTRLWRPIGLWDVEATIFTRQSDHRWRWNYQTYAPAALYTQEDSWCSFLLQDVSTQGLMCGWKEYVNWKKSNHFIGNRNDDHPAYRYKYLPCTYQRYGVQLHE
jgi:hypothetical protein